MSENPKPPVNPDPALPTLPGSDRGSCIETELNTGKVCGKTAERGSNYCKEHTSNKIEGLDEWVVQEDGKRFSPDDLPLTRGEFKKWVTDYCNHWMDDFGDRLAQVELSQVQMARHEHCKDEDYRRDQDIQMQVRLLMDRLHEFIRRRKLEVKDVRYDHKRDQFTLVLQDYRRPDRTYEFKTDLNGTMSKRMK